MMDIFLRSNEIPTDETAKVGIVIDPPIETILDEVQKRLNNNNVIKNISFDQSEILHNIMELYNDGEAFEADMTASELKFYGARPGYKYAIPEPKFLCDVSPTRDDIIKIEPEGPLPFKDNSIGSLVIDLPFVISPPNAPSAKSNKPGANMIMNRFSSYYPLDDLYASYYHWIKEAYRVVKPNGIVVFKCQNTVTGGINASSEEWSFMCAMKQGFYIIDRFTLQAKARLISSSKIKKQQHARKYTSSFYVFKKTIKKRSKEFNYFDLLEKCESQECQKQQ